MIVAFAAPFVAASPAGADLRLFLEPRPCPRVRPTRTREVFIVLVAIFLQPAPHVGLSLMPSKRSTSHFAFAPRARPYGARTGARWLPRGSWRTNPYMQTGGQIARVRCRVKGESGAFWRPDLPTREASVRKWLARDQNARTSSWAPRRQSRHARKAELTHACSRVWRMSAAAWSRNGRGHGAS